MVKNICCIGAGYVGGPTMSIIAQKNPDINVYVVDKNEKRIDEWNSSNLPIFEPGLDKVVNESRGRNLFFSTDVDKYITLSEMIFIAVNTPTKTEGEGKGYAADLTNLESCAKHIAMISEKDKIIVEKSTVPVKTSEKIREILNKYAKDGINFQILSNPEFLAEGTAMRDLEIPDRVIIGGEQSEKGKIATDLLVNIYSSWVPKENILTTNLWSSELSKLTANAFLAQRISSINSLSELCEETGADIDEVAKAIGMDSRIGNKFLKTSVAFGGSCFQKDILNLVYIAKSLGLKKVAEYWNQVIIINKHQRSRFAKKIIKTIDENQLNKKVSLLGWAFKKDTNDSRESASIYIAAELLSKGIEINVYDPKVEVKQIREDLKYIKISDEKLSLINYSENHYDVFEDSNVIAILTEWDEFVNYDWKTIYSKGFKKKYIFDGRNILDPIKLKEIGFIVDSIGKRA
tara:strand:- start:885 stop:2267 length:1383 start_codon:yes stop_codon:yes gene_type:complete